jgi:peptidoglycan lytic transglycosylase B
MSLLHKGAVVRIIYTTLTLLLLSTPYQGVHAQNQAVEGSNLPKANFAKRKDVQDFIQYLAKEDHFQPAELKKIFENVDPQPNIIRLMQKPYEALPWYQYQKHFLSPERVAAGVKFWQQHHAIFSKAEHDFGVPAEIILAILGVETYYGKRMSGYRVLDALATLAFDYPPRSHFFRRELREFLKLARQHQVDALHTSGSYAGAMGMPQFMPSSLARYGLDYDHDGKADIFQQPADAIGSIANYLRAHGWKTGQNMAILATTSSKQYTKAIATQNKRRRGQRLKPMYSLAHLEQHYALKTVQALPPSTHATVFTLTHPKHQQVWLGLNNFYVITTYNVSTNYAMTVRALAAAIKRANHNTGKQKRVP